MTTYSVVGRPVTREDGPDKVSGGTILPRRYHSARDDLGQGLEEPLPSRKNPPY